MQGMMGSDTCSIISLSYALGILAHPIFQVPEQGSK